MGLPLFGTGAGGYDAVRGEVLDAIVTECETGAGRHKYDAVIACRHRLNYAALQARRLGRGTDSPALPDRLMAEARRLGDLARTGQLALFLGAGISQPAGLPSWAARAHDFGNRQRPRRAAVSGNGRYPHTMTSDPAKIIAAANGGLGRPTEPRPLGQSSVTSVSRRCGSRDQAATSTRM